MIKKLLIANRGEIALRIVRACRELGVRSVAVYSQADEQSLAVQLADEAICIGPGPATESYLRSDRILSAAELADVDAIHPGYGFLSENDTFARQCEDCGIRFIGPKSETIRQMGHKTSARELAHKVGVPIIPGSDGPVESPEAAVKVAQKIGYPVIIKAASGGGGKGMRIAHNAVTLQRDLLIAQSEAEKNFGNAEVYIEKYIEEPRHIEIQVLCDMHGKHLHLGERDCSVQRRHQKLIEESPSPFLNEALRAEMGAAALKITKAVDYRNAGTIEFLVDKHGQFYFIEMNTRIQVEHGVTEEVTGIDLVKEQILIASGEHLAYNQSDIRIHRHAIECRVCAEDPLRDFAPSPGLITFYTAPGGHGVRVDSHIYSGYTVPPYYDSMIAKIITFGHNRTVAMDRMYRALSECIIRGIKTTIPFSRAIFQDPVFREGKATTAYIQDFLNRKPLDSEGD